MLTYGNTEPKPLLAQRVRLELKLRQLELLIAGKKDAALLVETLLRRLG